MPHLIVDAIKDNTEALQDGQVWQFTGESAPEGVMIDMTDVEIIPADGFRLVGVHNLSQNGAHFATGGHAAVIDKGDFIPGNSSKAFVLTDGKSLRGIGTTANIKLCWQVLERFSE